MSCPICKRPIGQNDSDVRLHPFCSRRCADVDLGRWLTGSYAIPEQEEAPTIPDDPSASH